MNAGWKRGSFTVEASILMPFLMWIIFVMLCLGLFWHDRSVLSACASELAGKGAARKYETEAHLESWLSTEASALVEDRLYLLKVTDITVKVTAEQVTVAYAGSSPVLGGLPNEGAGKIRTEKSGQPSSKNQTFKGTGRKGVKKWRLVTEGNWITIIWFWKKRNFRRIIR